MRQLRRQAQHRLWPLALGRADIAHKPYGAVHCAMGDTAQIWRMCLIFIGAHVLLSSSQLANDVAQLSTRGAPAVKLYKTSTVAMIAVHAFARSLCFPPIFQAQDLSVTALHSLAKSLVRHGSLRDASVLVCHSAAAVRLRARSHWTQLDLASSMVYNVYAVYTDCAVNACIA